MRLSWRDPLLPFLFNCPYLWWLVLAVIDAAVGCFGSDKPFELACKRYYKPFTGNNYMAASWAIQKLPSLSIHHTNSSIDILTYPQERALSSIPSAWILSIGSLPSPHVPTRALGHLKLPQLGERHWFWRAMDGNSLTFGLSYPQERTLSSIPSAWILSIGSLPSPHVPTRALGHLKLSQFMRHTTSRSACPKINVCRLNPNFIHLGATLNPFFSPSPRSIKTKIFMISFAWLVPLNVL